MTTILKILEIIKSQKQATAKELHDKLNVSQVLVHRHLKTLCERGEIKKVGTSPKVFYVLQKTLKLEGKLVDNSIIANNWLEICPNGEFLYGNEGFNKWCAMRNFNVEEKQAEFIKMWQEKEKCKQNLLIDATDKITNSFAKNYLTKVWYIDFYSWEIFGKTKLGKLLLYAKQNSDLNLMKEISLYIKEPITQLLLMEKFDLITAIPHSVNRKHNFLKNTLAYLNITPKAIFSKVFFQHVVAQKTLKSKIEREINARETLFLNKQNFPAKILLIDDACGSGATLNIAAEKIKFFSPNSEIYGLTFVGSLKGFDIIAET